ncbi:hypothetical protein ACUN90_20295, partial [Escherichia sp. SP-MK2]
FFIKLEGFCRKKGNYPTCKTIKCLGDVKMEKTMLTQMPMMMSMEKMMCEMKCMKMMMDHMMGMDLKMDTALRDRMQECDKMMKCTMDTMNEMQEQYC